MTKIAKLHLGRETLRTLADVAVRRAGAEGYGSLFSDRCRSQVDPCFLSESGCYINPA
jgi:hypothetical protein